MLLRLDVDDRDLESDEDERGGAEDQEQAAPAARGGDDDRDDQRGRGEDPAADREAEADVGAPR